MIKHAAKFEKSADNKDAVQAAIDAFLAQGGPVTVVTAIPPPKLATAK